MAYNFSMSEPPPASSDTAVSRALRAAAADIFAEARAALTDEALAEPTAVHEYRKAIKRWRALLRLVEPWVGSPARDLRRSAAASARTLAIARDSQSALEALDELGESPALSPRSRASLRERLTARRGEIGTASLTPALRRDLSAILADHERTFREWPLETFDFHALSGALTRAYRRTRRMLPRDFATTPPEALHEVRKWVVVHRYQMELVQPLWPKLGKLWVAEAQKLRDRLGEYQDLEVLRRLAGPHQPLAPWRSRMTPLIEARQGVLVAAAARLAGRLFAEKPKAFRARLEALWEAGEGDDSD